MDNLKQRVGNLTSEQRALLELLIKRKGLSTPEVGIARRSQSGPLPLSFAQQRIWFLDQLMPGNPIYDEPLVALRIHSAVNLPALQQTLDELVRRHESLRTTFPAIEGQPVQVVAPPHPVPIHRIDLRHLSTQEREARIETIAKQEARHIFDLAQGPLLRITLIQAAETEYVVLLAIHHIITDGWSNRILMQEVSELYETFCSGQPSRLAELPIQYGDFSIWQRQWLTGERLEELLAYWRKQLGNLPELKLPTDLPRPAVQGSSGATEILLLSSELSDGVRALSKTHGLTLFMTLLASFMTLLYRYTGQDDIVVGSPIANRSRIETERLIGFFVNTLVLRVDLSGNPPFRELLQRVRTVATEAYVHQDLPFEKLVEVLQPERSLSRQSLFQVLFGLHNYPRENLVLADSSPMANENNSVMEGEAGNVTLTDIEVANTISKFDLALSIVDLGSRGLRAQLDYSTDLFRAPSMAQLLLRFETLLKSVVKDPDRRLNSLTVFGEEDDERKMQKKKKEEDVFLKKLKALRQEGAKRKIS